MAASRIAAFEHHVLAPRATPQPSGWRWLYVDDARTHELRAGYHAGPTPRFLIRESAFREIDPTGFHEDALPVQMPWESGLYHWQLECRLSQLGRYWRTDALNPGWEPLRIPRGAPTLDLRGSEVATPKESIVLHHFHDPTLQRDRFVGAFLQPTLGRWQLMQADFVFPMVETSEIVVLHGRLGEGPMRSLLARDTLMLGEKGYQKLVSAQDYRHAFGPSGPKEAPATFDNFVERVEQGRLEAPRAGLLMSEDDAIYMDFLEKLNDPRIKELHSRYLAPGEEDALLAAGPVAIRRAISNKRGAADHAEKHLLSLLEASLLARERLRHRKLTRMDPEVTSLRRLAYYL